MEALEEKVAEHVEQIENKEKPAESNIEDKLPVNEEEKTEKDDQKLPDWARVHTDSWRQPQIFKPRKEIKVNDYAQKKETRDPNKSIDQNLPDLFRKKEEPNYWQRK